nr:uncharacterized protein DDB_G0284311-like [Setaria viridis]
MAATPLTWLESLARNSIDSWEDLKKVFTSNYAGAMQRPGNIIDLSRIKQQQDIKDKEIESSKPNYMKGQNNNNNSNGQRNHKNRNDHPNNDNQSNYLENKNCKRKPDNTVTVMQHSSKNGGIKNSDRSLFNELLKKQCPWHPYHKHSMWDCFSLRKAMKDASEPSGAEDKGKAKEDEEHGENGNF